jgi:hypothetical protein
MPRAARLDSLASTVPFIEPCNKQKVCPTTSEDFVVLMASHEPRADARNPWWRTEGLR